MSASIPKLAAKSVNHISICVCTYKRPQYLRRSLTELGRQQTDGRFTFSIVVADNDHLESGKPVVMELAAILPVPVSYCVEPRQNIALARNKAIENSTGNFIAFIDDDEFPSADWLLRLFLACETCGLDGALGPVRRHFDEPPPAWIVRGGFYDRPTHPTGLIIDWTMGRTNNALIKREIIPDGELAFRAEFRTGEDQDFFRRMIANGKRFVWCNEAIAYEVVPPIRWKRTFMMKRALLQGTVSQLLSRSGVGDIVKTLIAIPAYAIALPVALLQGQHRFVAVSVKLAYHLGRFLGFLHLSPIRNAYIVE